MMWVDAPYILHPLRVMFSVSLTEERIVAAPPPTPSVGA